MEQVDIKEYYEQQLNEMRLGWFFYYRKFEKDMDEILTEMSEKVCNQKTFELYDKIASWFDKAKESYMETL